MFATKPYQFFEFCESYCKNLYRLYYPMQTSKYLRKVKFMKVMKDTNWYLKLLQKDVVLVTFLQQKRPRSCLVTH